MKVFKATREYFQTEDNKKAYFFVPLEHESLEDIQEIVDTTEELRQMMDGEDKKRELLEELSEAVHKAYCLYQKEVKKKEYWTKGDYSKLKDEDKEADRYTVRSVVEVLWEKNYLPFKFIKGEFEELFYK